ncbi:hypothetical protein FZEAL_9725 [Fusarium zealandicum]|uniref:Nucleoside phosphorylase domain-containing protein n=1 Tax=Fusarium zealandicum TaxID=1053134 RepID=A0A8H4XE71_9HYPO|nr:hypothetical protein FZEAL_9725 [Fusarium zealandicum]
MSSSRPSSRDDFEVAIICALPLEYDAVTYVFDEFWDENGDQYGRASKDPNTYTTGRIGNYSVVLALLPQIGKANAASAAASMRSSYGGLRLCLLVGVCGGLPFPQNGEIWLGDVIISKTVVQYDFGRQYPDKFSRKSTIEDSLGRPNKDIRGLVATFETDRGIDQLEERITAILQQLQAKVATTKRRGKYNYLGMEKDVLFDSTERHKHHVSPTCICDDCFNDSNPVCDEAVGSSCADLGCKDHCSVARKRRSPEQQPGLRIDDATPSVAVHVGTIASGDSVIKSAVHRDKVSSDTAAIGFEMEGAGVWDEVPCIVVKGVCDYADSHKAKGWQNFAAATAASASKAILERYIRADKARQVASNDNSGQSQSVRAFSTVPFPQDRDFIERPDILSWLRDHTAQPGSRAALVGLGGIGKSQIAIYYAHQTRQTSPNTWVFWAHASSRARFEDAYRIIADRLRLPGRENPNHNVLQLVHSWLCNEENGPWVMILDNVDSADVFHPDRGDHGPDHQPLVSFLPKSGRGSVIVTSRNMDAAEKLAGLENILQMSTMSSSESLQLLRNRLGECEDQESTMIDLVTALGYLPLAISQAAAYIRRRRPLVSVSDYLKKFRKSKKTRAGLLSKEAADLRRDDSASNSIIATWQITLEQIRRERPSAADLLSFMSFFNPQGIPLFMLSAYSHSLSKDSESDSYDQDSHEYYSYEDLDDDASDGAERSDHEKLEDARFDEDDSDEDEDEDDDDETLGEDLEVLRGYSLVSVTKENETVFEMHPLVQFCAQRWLSTSQPGAGVIAQDRSNDYEYWRHVFFDVMLDKYPESPDEVDTWPISQSLDPHVDTIINEEARSPQDLPKWAAFICCVGEYRQARGKYVESERLYERALGVFLRTLGPEERRTMKSMSCLGHALLYQERFEEAEQQFRKVSEARERILGPDDPDTLLSQGNMIAILVSQRKLEGLEQRCRQMVLRFETVFGKDHPDTLTMMNHLGAALVFEGKYDEAGKVLVQVAQGNEKVFGLYHPQTLFDVLRISDVMALQGRCEEAEKMQRRVLEWQERILGREHPRVFHALESLGANLTKQRKYEEGERLLRRALDVSKKARGQWHPQTSRTLRHLRDSLYHQEKWEEMEDVSRQLLKTKESTPEKEDYITANNVEWLAYACYKQSQYVEAATLYERAGKDYASVVGSDNPYTERCNEMHGIILERMGNGPG